MDRAPSVIESPMATITGLWLAPRTSTPEIRPGPRRACSPGTSRLPAWLPGGETNRRMRCPAGAVGST
ncbi:hypothetical protein [Caulobacter sp. CCH9-E1]|uniref:hypothetical protein n=1 Tax=Caulobacter sp. CCH9-E1 TaxID=1768768 RepID=UPI0018D26346|nr:hypothetical protein [Caulobacter sp. CCH9-E1]